MEITSSSETSVLMSQDSNSQHQLYVAIDVY